MRLSKLLSPIVLLVFAAATARPAVHDIYPPPQQARTEIAHAFRTAAAEHKRVLLDFGGNWCADCHVLDIYLHNAQNLPLLDKNFVLVHVNVGEYDANLDLAQKYGIPLKKGVPALAVLDAHGKLLYSQKQGEFEAMGRMQPASVTAFLVQWRPQRPGCSVMMPNC